MKSLNFPEANLPLAEDQPQYETLYVKRDKDNTGAMTCCFELSEEEIEYIIKTRKFWFTQMTFNRGFSPISMSVVPPFEPIQTEQLPMDPNRTTVDIWNTTHYLSEDVFCKVPCNNCGKSWDDHFWSSRQCNL